MDMVKYTTKLASTGWSFFKRATCR